MSALGEIKTERYEKDKTLNLVFIRHFSYELNSVFSANEL